MIRSRRKELEAAVRFEKKFLTDAARYLELINAETLSDEDMAELEKYEYLSLYRISSESDIDSHREKLRHLRSQLADTENELTAAENDKKEYSRNYLTFIQQSQSDYDFIREQAEREKEKFEKAAELAEMQQAQENINWKNNYYI